jgi:hypothetical protein
MNPNRVKLSKSPPGITCNSATCVEPAEHRVTFVDKEGNLGTSAFYYCEEHYLADVNKGLIEVVD